MDQNSGHLQNDTIIEQQFHAQNSFRNKSPDDDKNRLMNQTLPHPSTTTVHQQQYLASIKQNQFNTLQQRPHSYAHPDDQHNTLTNGHTTMPKKQSLSKRATFMPGKSTSSEDKTMDQLNISLAQLDLAVQQGNVQKQIDIVNQIGLFFDDKQVNEGRDITIQMCHQLRERKALILLQENIIRWNSNAKLARYSWQLFIRAMLAPENRALTVQTFLDEYLNACKRKSTTGVLEDRILEDTDLQDWACLALDAITGEKNESVIARCIRAGMADILIDNIRQSIGVSAASTDGQGRLLTLRHSVIALSNMALYGASSAQKQLYMKHVCHWLYCVLLSTEDEITKFYAMLTASILASNKSLLGSVNETGILHLFESMCMDIDAGSMDINLMKQYDCRFSTWPPRRDPIYLERISNLLMTKEPAAPATHCIGALALAIEISGMQRLKTPVQDITEMLQTTNAILSLKKAAAISDSQSARKHAIRSLKLAQEVVPKRLVKTVSFWDVDDVSNWIQLIGYRNFQPKFKDSAVDGDLLLQLEPHELFDDLGIVNSVHRKRFFSELSDLKNNADYTDIDSTNIAGFLNSIGSNFVQYTHNLIHAGVDSTFLPELTDEMLNADCKILNGVHRKRIILAARELQNNRTMQYPVVNQRKVAYAIDKDATDVWIAAPDSGIGAATVLRALLHVNTECRVKMNVDRLGTAEYRDFVVDQIAQCSTMFVILTPNCMNNLMHQYRASRATSVASSSTMVDSHPKTHWDWFEQEISNGFHHDLRIIPIKLPGFNWPLPHSLPSTVKKMTKIKGLRWPFKASYDSVSQQERFINFVMKFWQDEKQVCEDNQSVVTSASQHMKSRSSIAASIASTATLGQGSGFINMVPEDNLNRINSRTQASQMSLPGSTHSRIHSGINNTSVFDGNETDSIRQFNIPQEDIHDLIEPVSSSTLKTLDMEEEALLHGLSHNQQLSTTSGSTILNSKITGNSPIPPVPDNHISYEVIAGDFKNVDIQSTIESQSYATAASTLVADEDFMHVSGNTFTCEVVPQTGNISQISVGQVYVQQVNPVEYDIPPKEGLVQSLSNSEKSSSSTSSVKQVEELVEEKDSTQAGLSEMKASDLFPKQSVPLIDGSARQPSESYH